MSEERSDESREDAAFFDKIRQLRYDVVEVGAHGDRRPWQLFSDRNLTDNATLSVPTANLVLIGHLQGHLSRLAVTVVGLLFIYL